MATKNSKTKTTAKKPTYYVIAYYKTNEGIVTERDQRIQKLAGRKSDGSGYDFSQKRRDLEFTFKTEDAAYAAAERIRRGTHRTGATVRTY